MAEAGGNGDGGVEVEVEVQVQGHKLIEPPVQLCKRDPMSSWAQVLSWSRFSVVSIISHMVIISEKPVW